MFLNCGVSQMVVVLLSPVLYFTRPLLPRKFSDVPRTILTISLHITLVYIMSLANIDFIEHLKETIVIQQCYPAHSLWFAVGYLFNIAWNNVCVLIA